MPSLEQLGRLKKKQYPGEYDQYDDLLLGRQFKADNPGIYDDYVDLKEAILMDDPHLHQKSALEEAYIANPRSAVSKTIDVAGKTLGATGDFTAKNVVAPLAMIPANEEQRKEIETRKSRTDRPAVASDFLEVIMPFLQEDDISAETESKLPLHTKLGVGTGRVVRTLSRLAADVALDPLTYVTGGQTTELGALRQAIKARRATGKGISLTSPLAKRVAKYYGKDKATPEMIRKISKVKPQDTFSKQVGAGEKSLFSFDSPLPNLIPDINVTGKLAGKIVQPLSALKRSQVGKAVDKSFRTIFSTKTGHPEFDTLRMRYHDLANDAVGQQIMDAKVRNETIQEITRASGKPREVIQREINSIVDQVTPMTRKQAEAVYPKAVREALDFHYTDKLVDSKLALQAAIKSGDQKAIELANKDVAMFNGRLNRLKGVYHPPTGINPQAEKMAREVKAAQENQLLAEQAQDPDIPRLLADRDYLPRILTPKAIESMRNKAIAEGKLLPKHGQKELDTHIGNWMTRQFSKVNPEVIDAWQNIGIINKRTANTFKGKNGVKYLKDSLDKGEITTAQYNDAVHALGIEDIHNLDRATKERIFGKDVPDVIFHEDPVYYTTIRNIRGQRAILASQFFDEMKSKGLAVPDKLAPADWVNVKLDDLTGHKVPPEIASSLNNWRNFQLNPEEFKQALNTYDRFHSLTKAWTLAIFPAYHAKNMVGNFWNNWLAGVNDPREYEQALQIQFAGSPKAQDLLQRFGQKPRDIGLEDIFGSKYTNDEVRTAMNKLGVLGHGQYGGDLVRTIHQAIEPGKWLTASSRSKLLRGGRAFGQFIEDNARAAHFISRVKKGDTFEQAALSVKKHLFDYGDLTWTEKNILNRTFFFYKWTKENLPLQLHHLVTTPWKFSVPFKLKTEVERESPLAREKYLAEWMKENFPVRLRYSDKHKKFEYFMLNQWLPAADLLKLAHFHEVAAQSLAPLPKELLQQGFNYDFYFKQPIDKLMSKEDFFTLGKEYKKFLGMEMPSRIYHGAKLVRLLNEIDRLTSSDKDLYSKMLGILLGQNQYFDETQGVIANKYRVDDEIGKLKGYMKGKAKKGTLSQKELDRVIQMILDKSKEY